MDDKAKYINDRIEDIKELYLKHTPYMADPFYVPRYQPNPEYRVQPTERVAPLREFNINGHIIMAKNHKEALKTAIYKGLVPNKKKRKK